MRLLVCPTDRAAAMEREHRPSHVLALASPGGTAEGSMTGGARLALAFHDIAEPRSGLVAPTARDVDAMLAFGRTWQGARPFLVHCALGISRSTAAALVVACDRAGPGSECSLAELLRFAAPCATPNPRIIALADDALGRGGRLVAAVAAIGRGADYVPQAGFTLDLSERAPAY